MSRIGYYVVRQGDEWRIKIGGKHYGPYSSQREAFDVAVATANKVGMTHRDGAKVLLQSTTGHQWLTQWTYGKDPFPPSG
jgi:Uncharacterized protein conserved in bacteria (DUF2188)